MLCQFSESELAVWRNTTHFPSVQSEGVHQLSRKKYFKKAILNTLASTTFILTMKRCSLPSSKDRAASRVATALKQAAAKHKRESCTGYLMRGVM